VVAGEYAWDSDCSWSGIQLAVASSRLAASPPPTLGYGISIARNSIRHADGMPGGAISAALSWYAGPPPSTWPMIDSTLIFANTIVDVAGSQPALTCSASRHHLYPTRMGINIDHAMIWRTMLFDNAFIGVSPPIVDAGSDTVDLGAQE
jgi:hypothetical protein